MRNAISLTSVLLLLLILALNILAGWIVVGPWFPANPLVIFLVVALFLTPSLGAFWLTYIAIRYEETPWRFVALALVPFGFLWYYSERYRRGTWRGLTLGD